MFICYVDGEGLIYYDAQKDRLTNVPDVAEASEASAADWTALMKRRNLKDFTLLKKP